MLGQSLDDLGKAYKSLGNKTDNWKTKTINAFKSISVARKAAAEEALRNSFNWGEDGSDIGNANKSSIEEWTDQRNAGNKSGMEKAYNNASRAVREYIDVTDKAKVSTDGFKEHQQNLINNLGKSNVAARAAAVGMKVLKAAVGMAVMAVLQFAIQKLIEGLDYLIHMQDKLNEKAEEARKQYEETTEELNAQEEALDKVKSRLVELNAIENPTLADETETAELEKQAAALALQVAYLRKKKELDGDNSEESDKKSWGWYTHYKDENSARSLYFKSELSAFGESDYDKDIVNLEKLKELREELNDLYNKGYSADKIESEKERLTSRINEIELDLSDSIEKIGKNKTPEAIEHVTRMQLALIDSADKAIILKTKLKELGASAEDLETLNKVANSDGEDGSIKNFQAALKAAIPDKEDRDAFIELAGGVDQLVLAFQDAGGNIEESSLESSLKEWADLSGFFDDAGNWAQEGIDELLTLSGEAFENKFEEVFGGVGDNAKDFLEGIFDVSGSDLPTATLDQYSELLSSISTVAKAMQDEFRVANEEAEKSVESFSAAFGNQVENISGTIDTIEEFSNSLKAVSQTYSLLSDAQEEYNANGQISLQTYLDLISTNSRYAEVLSIDETGAIHLTNDAREKMVMMQIEEIKKSLDASIAQKQHQITILQLQGVFGGLSQAMKDGVVKPTSVVIGMLQVFKQIVSDIMHGRFDFNNIGAMVSNAANNIMSSVGKDFSKYNTKAKEIASLNSEIAALKKQQSTVGRINSASDFNTYYTSYKDEQKAAKKESSSDDPRLEAWNEMLAIKKHQLEMDQITEEQYYAWLEANYKKQLNNQKKYADEWRQYEEEIYKWKKQKRLDDWNDAVDTKKHELEMGKIDEGEYYEWLARNYKSYLKDNLEEYRKYQEEIHKFEEQQGKESQDALEELIDLRVDMLKQEKENEKDVLKERQDNVKEFYDKQRDLLKEHYDKIDKEEERREKRKNVTDIQAELLELEADDSVEAQKRRLELEEELADAKKDLNDFERDEELEQAEKMYDDLEEMQTEYYDRQIEAIEDYLDDAYALRQQAIKDLQNGNAQLYQEMIEYNRQYGLIQWLTHRVICVKNYTYMRGLPKALHQNKRVETPKWYGAKAERTQGWYTVKP